MHARACKIRIHIARITHIRDVRARAYRSHTHYTHYIRYVNYMSCAQYMAPILLEISINVLFYIYVCELGEIKNFFCNIYIIFLY